MNTASGCGSGPCQCAAAAQAHVASVNGVALHAPGESLDAQTLRQRAVAELLRQQAVQAGWLERHPAALAPELDQAQVRVIEAMVEREAVSPAPSPAECRRYYDANKGRFIVGQALHVRHILFAVTPGVNVHALAQRAELALLELVRKDVPVQRFEQLATELSNCPSSAQGGDLGWLSPEDCAPELANELFFQTDSRWGMGVHPRLVHTRFGLHIIEVLGRRKGRLSEFERVQESIATQLALHSQATALHQYLQRLAAQAQIDGVDLAASSSPRVR